MTSRGDPVTEPLARIVLGHNPFFGVDHLSRERGAAREARFSRVDAVLDIIDLAVEHGAEGLMMSTHPRANDIAGLLADRAHLRDRLRVYPLLPYIAKYVRQANEKGLVNVVLDQLRGTHWSRKLNLLSRGGLAALRRDLFRILSTLIEIELAPFRRLDVHVVFLHDALTDLGLGLDAGSVFTFFRDELASRHGATAGFATKNLPLLLERFASYGLATPVVLTHVNRIGFNMNPSQQACEPLLRDGDVRVMAMGTLASGYLRPDDAYAYLARFPRIESVVVGASTPAHIRETFAAIRRHMPRLAERPAPSARRPPATQPSATQT